MSEKPVSREVSLRRRKTTSSYHYRRRSKALYAEQYSAELKHVLGLTLKTNCAFSCDPNTGLLAYPAGCVIVLFNPRLDKQTHIFNPEQKTLTCLKFSTDGHFIVTGEAGHRPCVRIFSVADRCQVVAFSSHKFGISCVAFSPNGKYVTSIGFQHDNVINVWDWKRNKLAASNKVSTKVKSIAYAGDSSHFITVGNRHVKYWYLEEPSADQITVPLKGRSAILETLRNHVFCDVICGNPSDQYAYAISRSGILCKLNCGRTVEKHVELHCGGARSICALNDMILCSCSNGSVQVYNANSLEFVTEIFPLEQLRGTEIIAIAFDVCNMWMHCVFADHSFVVHDIVDMTSPKVHALHQFHGSCIWDVKVLPYTSECDSLPRDCFLTCSNDGSVRAWHIENSDCRLLKVVKLHKGIDDGDNNSSSKLEARSLCVRSDGKHLAIGDKSGSIHVYNLDTFEKIAHIPTHEGDVLCMDFSQNGDMLASASRDRCVHTFDSRYSPTHTIADHSAAVTSVKFAQNENDFRLITCGSDKSLYFRSVVNSSGKTEIAREQHFVEKHSMTDMAVLDDTVLLACGCNLSEYDVIGGKLRRTFRGNETSVSILRVEVNNHRTLVATSCADKHIYLLSFTTGDCLNVLTGHSEIAVALSFDGDNRLLSASADGCLFVWALTKRVADDFRNLQLHSNPGSNVSTPDSPDLDKTAYFIDAKSTAPQDDHKLTPKTLADESFSAMFYNNEEKHRTETLQATPVVSTISSSNDFDLPAWVIKSPPAENDISADSTPRMAFGKWGHRREAEKLCEELGNLPIAVDLTSIRSSIDDDSEMDDGDDEGTSEDDSSDQLTTEELPNKPAANGIEESPVEDESQNTTISNNTAADINPKIEMADEKVPSEMPPSEKNVTGDAVENSLKPMEVEKAEKAAQKYDNSSSNLSNAVPDLLVRPNVDDCAKTTSEQSVLNSIQLESASKLPENDNTNITNESEEKKHFQNQSNISPISERKNSLLDNVSHDEDVDMRNHYYQIGNSHHKLTEPARLAKTEHEMHSTPKSHFTASVDIKLTSFPRTTSLEKKDSLGTIDAQKQNADISAAVNEASKTLVDQILSEVGKTAIDEFHSAVCESNALRLRETITDDTVTASCRESDTTSVLNKDQDDETVSESSHNTQDNSQSNYGEALRCQEDSPNIVDVKSSGSKKNSSGVTKGESSKTQDAKPHQSAAIPPAFAELIASLTRKKSSKSASNPNSIAVSSGFRQSGLDVSHRTRSQRTAFSTGRTVPDINGNSNFNEVESASRSSSRTNSTSQQALSEDESDECQKVSDELMALFNRALVLYRKRQIWHDANQGLSNGTSDGYHKLIRTFQIMHSRLNRLKSVASDPILTPDPCQFSTTSRSMSLDDLADDSPVVTLLREYSDKLVGLVHNQVDSKVFSTPADTV